VSSYPGPHPEPHADLSARQPLVSALPVGKRLYRLHRKGEAALFFGKTKKSRFDAPDASYGVLYLGKDAHCAFIETFGQSTGESLVTVVALQARLLAEVVVTRECNLIDGAHSGGLARIGADGRLLDGPHDISQRWSLALKQHPANPDGILYLARHDPARMAYALFDNVEAALTARSMGSLADPANAPLLADILNTYNFGLVD